MNELKIRKKKERYNNTAETVDLYAVYFLLFLTFINK